MSIKIYSRELEGKKVSVVIMDGTVASFGAVHASLLKKSAHDLRRMGYYLQHASAWFANEGITIDDLTLIKTVEE